MGTVLPETGKKVSEGEVAPLSFSGGHGKSDTQDLVQFYAKELGISSNAYVAPVLLDKENVEIFIRMIKAFKQLAEVPNTANPVPAAPPPRRPRGRPRKVPV